MTLQIPVTVVAGSPGGDESRLMNRVRSDLDKPRVAAIVPKGRSRTARFPGALQTTERLVRLGEGCSCCTVRGDLLSKVRRIANEGTADHVVIQAPAHADLVTLAKTFTVSDDQGRVLSSVAHIASMVVVVNGPTLLADLQSKGGRRLVERIELADVIVVLGNAGHAFQTVRALNNHARLHHEGDAGSLDRLQADIPFDLPAAQRRAALADVLGQEGPTRVDGVSRFAFRARRPFHPGRLHDLLQQEWREVLRAQGAFWVATRPNAVGLLDTVAGQSKTSLGGHWWASVPEAQHPNSPAFKRQLEERWHPSFGDRMQELAIVALGEESALQAHLTRCLLTEDELSQPERWGSWHHPFSWPEEGT